MTDTGKDSKGSTNDVSRGKGGKGVPPGSLYTSRKTGVDMLINPEPAYGGARTYVPVPPADTPAADRPKGERGAGTGADVRREYPAGSGASGIAAEDRIASVDFEQIRDKCRFAKGHRRKIIAIVGLAATGKSYLLHRLADVLKTEYGMTAHGGLVISKKKAIGRTKDVLLYHFNKIDESARPSEFDVYDVPGDQFARMVGQGWVLSGSDWEQLKLFYAVFAYADALIFVAPAMQVLMREEYIEHGDSIAADKDDRKIRADDIEAFVASLDPMTRMIVRLRDLLPQVGLEDAVNQVVKLSFPQLMEVVPATRRLPMPALLLLSRAYEIEPLLSARDREWYDADPAANLCRYNPAHFEHLAHRFEAFSVDFLTAELKREGGADEFDPSNPHYGADGVIQDWLLPAIDFCALPRWRRWLQRPVAAVRLRRLLDTEFGRIGKRKKRP
jgi:hypothetical protein